MLTVKEMSARQFGAIGKSRGQRRISRLEVVEVFSNKTSTVTKGRSAGSCSFFERLHINISVFIFFALNKENPGQASCISGA